MNENKIHLLLWRLPRKEQGKEFALQLLALQLVEVSIERKKEKK